MHLKQIRGLPVIDPTAARKLGTVADYQVDPVAGRLAALDIDHPDGHGGERIAAERIRRVGGSAVILTARGGATPGSERELNAQWLDTSTLAGLEVMGDDGDLIGRLMDATFNQDTLEIDAYLLRASFLERLFGRRGRIEPRTVHACSRELMLVATGRLKNAETPTPTTSDDTVPDVRVPLKDADRVQKPTIEAAPDGRPVATRRS